MNGRYINTVRIFSTCNLFVCICNLPYGRMIMKNLTNGGYKPGFNWQDRTIRPLVPDGTRYMDIMIRLDEIAELSRHTFKLTYELQKERSELVNELYQIGREKYHKFLEGK